MALGDRINYSQEFYERINQKYFDALKEKLLSKVNKHSDQHRGQHWDITDYTDLIKEFSDDKQSKVVLKPSQVENIVIDTIEALLGREVECLECYNLAAGLTTLFLDKEKRL